MFTESWTYDDGKRAALAGIEFETIATDLARKQTCSDRFLVLYEALERGYAEGMRSQESIKWWDDLPPLGRL